VFVFSIIALVVCIGCCRCGHWLQVYSACLVSVYCWRTFQ